MGDNREPPTTRRDFMRCALTPFFLAVCARPAGAAAGAPAAVEGLLAKIKAEHPEAEILKIELLRGGEAGLPEWIYEVKLFPPDGRILKLTYDAKTLALVEALGGEYGCGRRNGPRRRRLRLRRGW
jgi:hypothetical protein